MRRLRRPLKMAACALLVALAACSRPVEEPAPEAADERRVRLALFNVRELSAEKLSAVDEDGTGLDPQLRAAAAIVQRVRPDVLVLQEIDVDAADPARNLRRFRDAYLRHGEAPLDLEHAFAAPSNTGLLSGVDLDGDGVVATADERGDRAHGNDSFGFGVYPGQYAMGVLSSLPIEAAAARTFQRFLWRDLPGHHLPQGFYSAKAASVLRLSSKSHWDLPIRVGASRLHLWISHPTPPVFDGPENRNGRRNYDEIAFWVRYLEDEPALYDDDGTRGGYRADEPFVIVGDLNAAPTSEEAVVDGRPAIAQLLEHPALQDTGAVCVSGRPLGERRPGPPDFPERATAAFGGGQRVDYLLPSAGLMVAGGGVFWPDPEDDPEGAALAEQASDHRLLWIDLAPGG